MSQAVISWHFEYCVSIDIQALPQDVCCCAYKVSSISHNDAVIGHDVLQIVQQFQWIQMLLERFL